MKTVQYDERETSEASANGFVNLNDKKKSQPQSSVAPITAKGNEPSVDDAPTEKQAESSSPPNNKTSAENTKKRTPFQAYLRLWTYATWHDTLLRVIGIVAALGAGTGFPLMTIIFGRLVNDFNFLAMGLEDPATFRRKLNRNALWFVYLFIGKVICKYIASVLFSITASRTTKTLRTKYLTHIIHSPIAYFDTQSPGVLASSLANDPNLIEVGMAEKVATVFQSLSMLVSAFIIGLTYEWKLALVCAVVIPYTVVTTGFLAGMTAKLESRIRKILNEAGGLAEEALSSISNVLALDASEKLVKKFSAYISQSNKIGLWMGPLSSSIYGNMFFSMHCAYGLALFYGALLVARGEVKNGGTVLTVLYCTITGNSAMGLMAPSIPDLVKGAAAAQRILETLEPDTTARAAGDRNGAAQMLEHLKGAIELQDITFAYPSRPTITVLDNLSLSFPANQVTAIVGGSGSGKSTLIALLERWYQPSSGSIRVDGEDLGSLDLKWWRGQISLVQQEPMLFNDTILENVLNGLIDAYVKELDNKTKRQLVIDACVQANAHDFISALPEGYDTVVGERANQLSGGQKQRIAIARAIISNPKVLLLDEATSALDPQSEHVVQDALEKVSLGKTTIMVAHRLATVQRADHIVVMGDGKIIEMGTHEELLARGEAYCRLLAAQQEGTPPATQGVGEEAVPLGEALTQIASMKQGEKVDGVKRQYLPLHSPEIGRRYSLLRCLWIVLRNNMSAVPEFVLGFAGSFMSAATYPVMALLFSRLITTFQFQGDKLRHRANFWGLMFFILGLADIISYFIIFYLFGLSTLKIMGRYRKDYFQAMLRQDLDFSQVEGNESGTLNALLFADAEDLELLLAQNIGLVAVFVIDLVACCVLALAVYWKLALVCVFGCLPALLGSGFVRMRFDTTAQVRCAKLFLESARFSTEAIGAVRTVASLNLEAKVVERFDHRLKSAVEQSIRSSLVGMIFFALSDTLDMLVAGLCWWYGGRLTSFGELSGTQYFIVFVSILFGGQAAGFMFGFTSNFAKGQVAANRILYLVDQKPLINGSQGLDPTQQPKCGTIIEFRNVNFVYPRRPDVRVLKDVSLEVKRGDNICIVGPSGCGKSTVVSLLERFYGPRNGEIRVHGMNIAELDIKAYRSMLGLVSQETILYRGSVRENLLLGVPPDQDISEAEVEEACRTANIHDFITSLPQGYHTDVGPKGTALSGGQRQRIALARALVRKSEILLLDEATSALDSESEAQVREALDKASEGRTTVNVTHHAEVMKQADAIIVMEKGRIVETGRYADLMEKRGRFWRMNTLGELEP